MRLVTLAALALALGAAGFAGWVRLAPDDAARWHADPLAGPYPGSPNQFLLSPEPVPGLAAEMQARAPVVAATPERLAAAFDAAAMAAPRVTRLAGSVGEGFVTYVQRSALMAYPDYISVRVLPAPGGATLAVWSRSRYGYSDLGVNAARVDGWVKAAEAALGG